MYWDMTLVIICDCIGISSDFYNTFGTTVQVSGRMLVRSAEIIVLTIARPENAVLRLDLGQDEPLLLIRAC